MYVLKSILANIRPHIFLESETGSLLRGGVPVRAGGGGEGVVPAEGGGDPGDGRHAAQLQTQRPAHVQRRRGVGPVGRGVGPAGGGAGVAEQRRHHQGEPLQRCMLDI